MWFFFSATLQRAGQVQNRVNIVPIALYFKIYILFQNVGFLSYTRVKFPAVDHQPVGKQLKTLQFHCYTSFSTESQMKILSSSKSHYQFFVLWK